MNPGYPRTQAAKPPARKMERAGQFTEEMRELMYACGDCVSPNQNTMNLVENYMIEYLYSLLQRATNRSAWRGGAGSKVDINDLHYLEEDDELIFHRVKYLLEQQTKMKKTENKVDTPASP